ncbi:plasmid replication protein, CyRepA1 family [Mesorhizobium sp. M0006]|uniref:plasmid replication protein, CyRepA1 family n=1 Tax=Mesorhizobium sp. M0006 TaxID=2956838 RepID=UPI00333C9560
MSLTQKSDVAIPFEPTSSPKDETPSPDGRLLKVAISTKLVDKILPKSRSAYATDGWENVELSTAELIAQISDGFAYCSHFGGSRSTANFKAADIVSVDIDQGLGIEDALGRPIVRDHAAFLYTTPSHTAEHERFRIVFVLPHTIEEADEIRAVSRSLALRLGGDIAATDACRISFGNSKAKIYHVGKMLSTALVRELIDQTIDSPSKPDGEQSYRSRLTLETNHLVRTELGETSPFSRLGHGDRVFCPYHSDENASAFVVRSGNGTLGIHCSTCQLTYWPVRPDDHDFEEFENAAKAAAAGALSGAFENVNVTIGTTVTTPRHLVHPLTFVKAPKGSGKTEGLVELTGGEMKVLLVGHRRLLGKQSARRLELHSYLDRDTPRLWRGDKDERLKRFAVSVDSLGLIPSNSVYDIIIVDESEQVLSHFLSETIGQGDRALREDLFKNFENLCRRAKHAIALDADLGWLSFYVLSQMKFGTDGSGPSSKVPTPDEFKTTVAENTLEQFFIEDEGQSRQPITKSIARSRLIINESQPGEGKKLEVYASPNHLIGELMGSLADGKRCLIVSNSKDRLDKLEKAIREKLPAIRALLVTSDTNNDASVQRFIAQPAAEFENYDVVLGSPTMGTGVDITFPKNDERVDIVFGFCEANITTHFDFDQQLGRVRHPKAIKVWLSPQISHYETSTDVVKRDILERGLLGGRVEGYTDEGKPKYRSGDLLLEMAALSVSQRRASMNKIKANFIHHKERQGFAIAHIEKDAEQAEIGSSTITLGRALQEEEYAGRVLSATTLRRREFNELLTAAENGEAVSQAQRWSLERTRIELFYRARATKELILQDARGKGRRKIRMFGAILDALNSPFATREIGSFTQRDRFLRDQAGEIHAFVSLLKATPLLNTSKFSADAEIRGGDLADFVKLVDREKGTLETQLNIEMRKDVARKPIQQLNAILSKLGLTVVKVGSENVAGTKIRYYSLKKEALAWLKGIYDTRKAVDGWGALAGIYGWSPDDDDDFDEDDVDH